MTDDDVFESAPPREILELFLALAGVPSPAMFSGVKHDRVMPSKRRHRNAERSILKLGRANPKQTRGTSRTPHAQEIAHAIGSVSQGVEGEEKGTYLIEPDPIGAGILYDMSSCYIGHPGVREAIFDEVVSEAQERSRVTPNARRARLTRRAIKVRYDALVLGKVTDYMPREAWAWMRICNAVDAVLTHRAGEAARSALKWLR